MGPRTRNRNLTFVKRGTFVNYFNGTPFTSLGGNLATCRQTCSDTTGPIPYVDHSLTLFHYHNDPLIMNGSVTISAQRQTVLTEYNPPNRSDYTAAPNPTAVDWSYYKTLALANMNPNKPTVDLPVFLFELKDFPGMLRDLGRILQKGAKLSDGAGAYVAYSFGWAPLISDVSKLLDFSDAVNNRLKYLQKTSAKGGAKITRTLEQSSNVLSSSAYTVSAPNGGTQGPSFDGWQVTTEKRKVWAAARVASFLSPVQLDDPQATAARAALGLNLSAASLWEAIPWSWLIDYFVNVGNFLDANRGFISSRITDLNLMCTQTVESKLTGKANYGFSAKGGDLTTILKSRNVSSVPNPSIALRPWFTPHMAGILGSLASAKALKRIGK